MAKDAVTLEAVYIHTHKQQLRGNLEKTKRVQYIDIARGIAIILMIIGHVIRLWRSKKYNFFIPYAFIHCCKWNVL